MIGAEVPTPEQEFERRHAGAVARSRTPMQTWYRVRLGPRWIFGLGGGKVWFADGCRRRVYGEEVWAYADKFYFAMYDEFVTRTVYAYDAAAQPVALTHLAEF